MKLPIFCAGEEVWKKIEHLRDERKKIQKKIKQSQKSGASSDDVYKPTLWWFKLLDFVDIVDNVPKTANNLDCVSTVLHTKFW
jgi:hypothetical protein